MDRCYLNGSRGNAAYNLRGAFKLLGGRWSPEQKLWWFTAEEAWEAAAKCLSDERSRLILEGPYTVRDLRRSGGQDHDSIEQGFEYPPGLGW